MPFTLEEKYAEMQMDPSDLPRWAAFDAFCWQHIHQHLHGQPNWIAEVRQGTIPLHVRGKKKNKLRPSAWNSQLNAIALDLVLTYAERIWPDQKETPAHLCRTAPLNKPYMRATAENLCADERAEKRMRVSGVGMKEEDYILESTIGLCVRDYLHYLVESDEPVPAEQQSKAFRLLGEFLGVDMPQPSLPQAHLHPLPMSDVPRNKHEELEEGEIEQHPKRKLPDTFESAEEPEQQPRDISDRTQQTETTIGDLLDRYCQEKKRRMASASRTRTSQSSTIRSIVTAKDTGGGRSQSARLSPMDTGDEVISAVADCFQSGPGAAILSNVSDYRCCTQDCNATFNTSQELDEHLRNQHSAQSQSFTNVPFMLAGVSPQRSSPGLHGSADSARPNARKEPEVQSNDPPSDGHESMSVVEDLLLQDIEDEEYAELCRRSLVWLRSQGKPFLAVGHVAMI